MTVTHPLLSVCVFCASSDDVSTMYVETARELGRGLAARGWSLVYGGGNNGLMGVLAAEMHGLGARITGVIPVALRDRGWAYEGVDEIIVTDGLRERKAIMEARAGAFVGMPGGFGTLEEMLEIITLRQLGMHDKPIVFLDVDGFFRGILDQFETGYRERFIAEECRNLYHVAASVADALEYLSSAR